MHRFVYKHSADSPEDSGYCQLPSIPRDKCTLSQKKPDYFCSTVRFGRILLWYHEQNTTGFRWCFVWHEVASTRKRVQAAGNRLISTLLVRLDAELARRGSGSSCPCHIWRSKIFHNVRKETISHSDCRGGVRCIRGTSFSCGVTPPRTAHGRWDSGESA
jgi:hypothetical protein